MNLRAPTGQNPAISPRAFRRSDCRRGGRGRTCPLRRGSRACERCVRHARPRRPGRHRRAGSTTSASPAASRSSGWQVSCSSRTTSPTAERAAVVDGVVPADVTRPGRDHAQPRGRRHEPARRGDRGPRGRARRLAADASTPRTRAAGLEPAAGREACPPGRRCSSDLRERGIAIAPRSRSSTKTARSCRRRRTCSARRAPRPGAGHRPPRPRRDLRRRRRRRRAGRARHRRHAPGVPVAEPVDRGPDRAGAARARSSSAAS